MAEIPGVRITVQAATAVGSVALPGNRTAAGARAVARALKMAVARLERVDGPERSALAVVVGSIMMLVAVVAITAVAVAMRSAAAAAVPTSVVLPAAQLKLVGVAVTDAWLCVGGNDEVPLAFCNGVLAAQPATDGGASRNMGHRELVICRVGICRVG